MKIVLPQEAEESKKINSKALKYFLKPEFTELLQMDKFITISKILKEKIPKILGDFKYLGIVGIGGSQVQPLILNVHSKKKIFHLESPDPYSDFKTILNKDKSDTRILYLSRSGITKEVLSFIPYLKDFMSLAVTNGGSLLKIAEKLNFPIIKVSYDISGRFAIANELGIIPMIAMGIDPTRFLSSLKQSYNDNFKIGSVADKTAIKIYNLEKTYPKMKILTSGLYPSGLGILFTQLINESTPKKETDSLDSSLHPMPRSAHSDVQRWYGGIKDSFVFSILCNKFENDICPKEIKEDISDLIPGINKKAGIHLNITSKAVEDTFPGPVFKIILENDSLEELAYTIGYLHAVTVRLCQLKGSDPFNQPAVQKYKEKATDIYNNLK